MSGFKCGVEDPPDGMEKIVIMIQILRTLRGLCTLSWGVQFANFAEGCSDPPVGGLLQNGVNLSDFAKSTDVSQTFAHFNGVFVNLFMYRIFMYSYESRDEPVL